MRVTNTAYLLVALSSISCGASSGGTKDPIVLPSAPSSWATFDDLPTDSSTWPGFTSSPSPDISSARRFRARGTFEQMASRPRDDGTTALLAYYYFAPIMPMTPLADGELRRQIGIRLRAQDDCNAIYVMWFVGTSKDDTEVATRPEGIYVQEKLNPGMTKQSQCKDGGFTTYKPALAGKAKDISGIPGSASWVLPKVAPGEVNWLVGAIFPDGTAVAAADGHIVWHGALSAKALALVGSTGLRVDNGDFFAGMAVTE